MSILDISIIVFVVLESSNIFILYFAPDSKLGNGVAVFNQWNLSKEDANVHLFTRYLTNWVAGTKLIFVVLLLVILFTAGETTKFYAVVAMIISIATYYWKLHPIIKSLDNQDQITPKGYSKVLWIMITSFVLMFTLALISYLVINL